MSLPVRNEQKGCTTMRNLSLFFPPQYKWFLIASYLKKQLQVPQSLTGSCVSYKFCTSVIKLQLYHA